MAKQPIIGFHQDELGDWTANLACGHTQHVRHNPPWESRPWVETASGRDQHLGYQLECKKCEEPEGMEEVDTPHLFKPHPLSPAVKERATANLAAAEWAFQSDPSLENTVWLGRRLAYLFKLPEAIEVYSRGIERFPDAYELYRHRGHRYISMRRFAEAIADLERAAALAEGRPVTIEADGIPNRLNRPTSNSHFNIWYHLGLAYYLTGRYDEAAIAYETCQVYSDNPDSWCATADWYFMTLQRLGRVADASRLLETIDVDMEIIESDAYHRRLLMYKGVFQPEDLLKVEVDHEDEERLLDLVTQGYGVGNWLLSQGQKSRAEAIFQKILNTDYWSAFGYIAAEVDLLSGRLS